MPSKSWSPKLFKELLDSPWKFTNIGQSFIKGANGLEPYTPYRVHVSTLEPTLEQCPVGGLWLKIPIDVLFVSGADISSYTNILTVFGGDSTSSSEFLTIVSGGNASEQ